MSVWVLEIFVNKNRSCPSSAASVFAIGTMEDFVLFLWFSVVFSMGGSAFNSWYQNCLVPKTDIQIHYRLNTMLFEKVQTVDLLSCYETPEFYNTYTKAAI